MTTSRDTLSKSQTVTVAAIEERVSFLLEAREVIEKSQVDLVTWLERPSFNRLLTTSRTIRLLSARQSLWDGLIPDRGPNYKAQARKAPDVLRAKLDLLQARLVDAN
jgi:hypothetical protein